MATDTDLRLRSWLDSNQRDREQMCRSIVALNPRYSDVRPRHPAGGPDGGRDLELILDGNQIAFGAVAFMNGANDSPRQKGAIRRKFKNDLANAKEAHGGLSAFIFCTNLHLAIGEIEALRAEARSAGVNYCEVMDRERLRVELDSPAGFFIRFQHLGIPLSEAEQASFLSRYGAQIQEVVTTGFQRVEKALDRLLFLQEAEAELRSIQVFFRLTEPVVPKEFGHFRAFAHIDLELSESGTLSLWFGSTNNPGRHIAGRELLSSRWTADDFLNVAWEERTDLPFDKLSELFSNRDRRDFDVDPSWCKPILVHRRGQTPPPKVSVIQATYINTEELFRSRRRLRLIDLEGALLAPVLDAKLAHRLLGIEVFANGYRIATVRKGEFEFDRSGFRNNLPPEFSAEELTNRWVPVVPLRGLVFGLSFGRITPSRTFEYEELRPLV